MFVAPYTIRCDPDLLKGGKNMIKEAITELVKKNDLTPDMAEGAMDEIMGGNVGEIQMSAFLTALAVKGATVDEITACAKGMRKHCVKFLNDEDVLEIVGTGGDKAGSFNISTISAIVVSAAGVKVAKHGNRAATSKCGTADCLEALGAKLSITPERSKEILDAINFCFLFAQNYHLSMKYVAPVRRELPMPTVFNILGPLTNPAGASYQLLGVYDENLVKPLARVLSNLGVKRGMVVYGNDVLDEISVSAPTTVCEINEGEFKDYIINPVDYGFELHEKSDIVGGTPAENAEIARRILSGEKGAKRDAVLLNSGAALHITKQISISDGIKEAADIIDSGKGMKQLEEFVRLTNSADCEAV